MNNCTYYKNEERITGYLGPFSPIVERRGVCLGTKEKDLCTYVGCPENCPGFKSKEETKTIKLNEDGWSWRRWPEIEPLNEGASTEEIVEKVNEMIDLLNKLGEGKK